MLGAGLLLCGAGVNLLLIQFVLMRELAISLFCTELTILLVGAAYFLGYGAGYLLAGRVGLVGARRWLIAALLVHPLLIPALRAACGACAAHGHKAWGPPLVFVAVCLLVPGCYTVLLPVLVNAASREALPRYYRMELLGGVAGLVAILTLGCVSVWALAGLYLAILLAMIAASGAGRRVVAALAVWLVIVGMAWPRADRLSSEYFYSRFFRWLRGDVRILYSVHSPYQKIEVLQDARGVKRLWLNGLEYFNDGDLEDFNFYLTELSARLLRPRSVLIIGSGSMSALRHLAPYVERITTVEIDRQVADAGERFFADVNQIASLRVPWRLVIDDAKHFLSTTRETYDLILMDIPAPYYLQTALLFTQEFYALAKQHLNPGGMMTLYVAEQILLNGPAYPSARIMQAANGVFRQSWLVTSFAAENSFLYAGDHLPFDSARIRQVLTEVRGPEERFLVFDRTRMDRVLRGIAPASLRNLDIVWALSAWGLPYRFHHD